jgi:hypothetical protein
VSWTIKFLLGRRSSPYHQWRHRGVAALMRSFRPGYGLPDFSAAVGALIDEIDPGHAPMRLDLPDVHRQQPDAAGADDRSGLVRVVLYIGWHVGSPWQWKHGKPQPRSQVTADARSPSSILSNGLGTSAHCPRVWHSRNILVRKSLSASCFRQPRPLNCISILDAIRSGAASAKVVTR